MTRDELERLARAWRLRITTREVLFAAAAVCVVVAPASVWLSGTWLVAAACAVFAITLAARLLRVQPWRLGAPQLTQHLDRTFPQFEESSALWLRPADSLTLVERLQRARTDEAARRLSATNKPTFAAPPRDLLRVPLICLAAVLVLFVAVAGWRLIRQRADTSRPGATTAAHADEAPVPAPPATPEWPRLAHAEMLIFPPRYTGRPERRVVGLNAEVEEGAQVTWSVTLEGSVREAGLRFGSGDNDVLPLREEEGALRASRAVAETALYGLAAVTTNGAIWRPHELYSLKVIKDRPPALKILQPASSRTEIAPPASPQSPPAVATIEVLASDDYAIADAYLIATVAKGTGEAVKFREQKIAFDVIEPAEPAPSGRRLLKNVDLVALGLEPGDELYFHVEAADNREPASNRARSETRFIVLQGPEQSVSTPGAGVTGVNLIPQYFRSQRQIIIDTEKLIADQPTLSEPEFRNRANNLAIDQQLLRQRYGQFLGEEADHGDASAEATAADEHEHETHSPDDGHDHGHAPAAGAPSTQQEIMEQYGHQHDSQDEATLFDRETKGTMREALAAMWEAERLLRVAQAREALAPENRALNILKELQQADRAYVQRVGFEAAPIDFAARRMRGDVSDVPQTAVAAEPPATARDEVESDIRHVLRLAPWRPAAHQLTESEIDALRRVEPALMNAVTDNPDVSLGALEELRRLTSGETLQQGAPSELQPALLRMLPRSESQPERGSEASSTLADLYFRHLKEGH